MYYRGPEDDEGCAIRHEHLLFGTLVKGLVKARREFLEGCLEQGKKCLGQATEVHKVSLVQGKDLAKIALNEERNNIPKLYCIGPLIANRGDNSGGIRDECLSWLDSQPSRSVVYLSFGSRGVFSKEQLQEIADGLEKSNVRFLWVVRTPASEEKEDNFLVPNEPNLDVILPKGFIDRTIDRGFVAKLWVSQIEVLNHDCIGGFVSHCGWNSILEALNAGVPLVAWPLYAEQRFNKI
ncbi:UDP-glycosyltransferase 13-like [Amaranthus tricolor]|uniref:UDP-glycosyltransferase 13-like n=1 Tax=Amaranthus tricolor TaxID=29722 RepID=UPI0025869479|nr:UDP-glycosyltransferase 13-like [Amaranthus tricolor]